MKPEIILDAAREELETVFWDGKVARVTDGVVMVAERFLDGVLPDFGVDVNNPDDKKKTVEEYRVTGKKVLTLHINPDLLLDALNAMDYSPKCMRVDIYESSTGEGYQVCLSSKNSSALIMGLDEETTSGFKYFCPYVAE